MSYDVLEQSVQDGQPVYKFLFSNEAGEYRLTSASFFISDSNGTYTPAPIAASNVSQSNELSKNGVNITLPRDNEVSQLFLGKVPETPTSLTIYRSHDYDTVEDEFVYWKGRVTSASASGDEVTLQCEDIFTSMKRPGLRARYQKACRHALYSRACGVVKENYAVDATILSADGNVLTYTIDSSVEIDSNNNNNVAADNFFAGGLVELADGTSRYIIAQTTDTLELISQFEGLDIDSVGLSVTLYPGCSRGTQTCENKFDNLVNFGGFPYIPSKNPFANSVTGSIA